MALTEKLDKVAVSELIAIAEIPALVSEAAFCFPSRLSGVTTICMPLGRKSNGSQKQRVFPIPVPAVQMTSLSPFKSASDTLSCQRHGRTVKVCCACWWIVANVGYGLGEGSTMYSKSPYHCPGIPKICFII